MKYCPFLSSSDNPVECKIDCKLSNLKNENEICRIAERFNELEQRIDSLETFREYVDGDDFIAYLRYTTGRT